MRRRVHAALVAAIALAPTSACTVDLTEPLDQGSPPGMRAYLAYADTAGPHAELHIELTPPTRTTWSQEDRLLVNGEELGPTATDASGSRSYDVSWNAPDIPLPARIELRTAAWPPLSFVVDAYRRPETPDTVRPQAAELRFPLRPPAAEPALDGGTWNFAVRSGDGTIWMSVSANALPPDTIAVPVALLPDGAEGPFSATCWISGTAAPAWPGGGEAFVFVSSTLRWPGRL